MTDIRNVGHEVQAEILKTMRRGQESVRRGQETVAGAVKSWRAKRPALSELNLPFASRLPKPEELAANAHSFALRLLAEQRKLVAEQRKFAEGVLHSAGQLRAGTRPAARKTAHRHEAAAKPETAATPETAKPETPAKPATAGKPEAARKHETTGTARTAGTTRKTGPARGTGTTK
jgi:hypothetical protein